ncbi:MAG: outer membrane protein assembly factor BamB, partial [Myxococcota bacterium]
MRASIYLSLLRVAGCADRGTVTVPVTVVAGTSSSETAAQDTPTAKPTSTPKERADKPKAPLGEDITAAYIAMHDGTYAAPPTEFRSGHVSPKGFAGEHVTATDNGFRIRFPSKAPIVTPAVYDTKVVVSGGFRSKEMYAFDARTGAPAWGAALDDDGPSAPACAEGLCAFNTESCTLFVVDAATGKMRWSKWLGDPLASAPTVANGRVCTSYPAGDVRG